MNKRIQELAEEAGIHDDVCSMCPIHELEKFAELIVRECAEMVRIQNEQFMENESHYGVVSTDILKHFGIKE
jgi:hypothetical protein